MIIFFLFPEGDAGDDDADDGGTPGAVSNPSQASAEDTTALRSLKILKGLRAVRVVVRVAKVYMAKLKLDEDNNDMSSVRQSQELEATVSHFCQNRIPDLLYSLIEHAGDDTLSQELAQRAYTFATLLLEQPRNKEVYLMLQTRSKADDTNKAFFGESLQWDTGVYAFDGAVSVALRILFDP